MSIIKNTTNKMRVFITGGDGLVGGLLKKVFEAGNVICSPGRKELDITCRDKVIRAINSFKPDVLIHCAAFTDVDGCENESKRAYLVNALGTQYVSEGCAEANSKIVYISTDFIFDGRKRTPYSETDPPSPLSIYARSKLLGEYYVTYFMHRFMIIRVSKVFGKNGRNFASSMPELMKKGEKLLLTKDVVNSPTYALDLARAVKFLVEKNFYGVINVCNKGECSWYEYGLKVKEMLKLEDSEVVPVKFSGFKNKQARRPHYSVLNTELLETVGFSMPDWQDALSRYLSEL